MIKVSLTKDDLQVLTIIVNDSNLVANVIYEAIKCKSYPTLPRKIGIIVEKVTEIYKREFEKISDDFYCKEFQSVNELVNWLYETIFVIPEIQELNLSQSEFESGIAVDDTERDPFVFTYRYSKPCAEDDDFVGLDAFTRNLAHNLVRENVEIDYSSFYKD